jgi:nicotinate-nucleotide pyrophosphorylase (carboxylating)
VAAALREDLGERGDITTEAVVPPDFVVTARVIARQNLVAAGLPVAREVFRQLDAETAWEQACEDGDLVEAGRELATVRGRARPILQGERTALNFLMRMSGIATAARAAVEEIAGTGATILDTRKTAPGLRFLDKYSVAAGGASNHRFGLYDAVMVKDTHLATAASVGEAVQRVLRRGHPPAAVTAEVRDPDQLEEAIEAGAGRALLDNMDLETLAECVRRGKGRIVLEASGGLRPGKLRAAAETGVDFLSLGWLTHSAPAADISMEIETS